MLSARRTTFAPGNEQWARYILLNWPRRAEFLDLPPVVIAATALVKNVFDIPHERGHLT